MPDYEKYINKLDDILKINNVCLSHGIQHAITVMCNAKDCLDENKVIINSICYELKEEQVKSVLLAALLHDADDKKFFPNNKNYENLRIILQGESEEFINIVMTMVDLVSSSKNGDRIPEFVKDKLWMLIPRYADRLEAIGIVGIERCYQYGKTTKNPLFLDSTPRPLNISEIWNYASQERYDKYTGKSDSMMDHYFDKLVRLTIFPFRNEYLDYQCSKRRQPIIDFILFFSDKKILTDGDILNFIKNYKYE
jgi:uncharacterized protein